MEELLFHLMWNPCSIRNFAIMLCFASIPPPTLLPIPLSFPYYSLSLHPLHSATHAPCSLLRRPFGLPSLSPSLSLSLFLLQQAALTLMEQHFAINALHTHEPEWDEDADGRADGRTGGRTAGLRNRRTHLYTTRIMDVYGRV